MFTGAANAVEYFKTLKYVGLLLKILNINPFVTNAPFLYPPENIRKLYGFLMFSGGRERMHWEQMG